MKHFLITIFQICIFAVSHAQSPTFRALLELNYNIDNNHYDLKNTELSKVENSFYTNVFFKYYKNPNIQNANPDESFIFSVGYQYLIGIKVTQNSSSEFSFPLYSKNDKKGLLKITTIDPSTGKESKVKGKYYETKVDGDLIKLTLAKNSLQIGSVVKILFEIESFYFKELMLTPQINVDIDKRICSTNIPQIFRYQVQADSSLENTDKSEEFMQLKHLTYRTPPIEDYNVNSFSTQWILDSSSSLKLILGEINLPVDLGTSVEQIMKYSN